MPQREIQTKGSGLKIKTSCTTTSDTVCEPLEGFFCLDSAEDGCMSVQRHALCQPGQYIRQYGVLVQSWQSYLICSVIALHTNMSRIPTKLYISSTSLYPLTLSY